MMMILWEKNGKNASIFVRICVNIIYSINLISISNMRCGISDTLRSPNTYEITSIISFHSDRRIYLYSHIYKAPTTPFSQKIFFWINLYIFGIFLNCQQLLCIKYFCNDVSSSHSVTIPATPNLADQQSLRDVSPWLVPFFIPQSHEYVRISLVVTNNYIISQHRNS